LREGKASGSEEGEVSGSDFFVSIAVANYDGNFGIKVGRVALM
jgi:hypothetical protein